MAEGKKGYKDTLNLPKSQFPMRADLPRREPELMRRWAGEDIYRRILARRAGSGKRFLLHDGPPYANGHIHMGHVLNKTLKDICVKYASMRGFLSPYVPGWDCHGLPVEHQLLKELKLTKHEIDQVEFRKKAYRYAMKFVGIQAEEFKRLGIFGDWDNPYLTLTTDYEADILLALADLYGKGYIYKDLKPVNWCKKCETALAEAEVEHNDKTSPSVYVRFDAGGKVNGKPAYFIIWTTTPWTLLANVAVALHPDFNYVSVDTGEEVWIAAEDLAENLMEKAGVEKYEIAGKNTGAEVAAMFPEARHPFIERGSAVVLADYVTGEEGTGCVHTAPGHGQDDYATGKKYGLDVLVPVNDKGRFKEGTGEFSGMDVFEANGPIIEKMRKTGALVAAEDVRHSYPHCWRCQEPIIFRATEQWFMSVDHEGLRGRMEEEINNKVKWVPAGGRDRIGAMVSGRPDWCLSRQRYWGVPIPAFKCGSCGEAFTSADLIRDVAALTREKGSNVWFEREASELLPEGTVCARCGGTSFEKEGDILDVWFDSGVSHKAVLDAREGLDGPADLYLEGSDQHRGWFQSSLITSMAMNGCAPYRQVLTHGFVVDGEGKKMSKSLGNVISPQDIMKKYGADILRLWVAASDYEGDIKLSSEILERLADGYRKIRNTFRFLLSNLYDFDPARDAVDTVDMAEIDRWMMSRLSGLVDEVTGYYEEREFHRVYRKVYDFCVYEISSFYLDVLKDTLYIASPGSAERRSPQTVIFRLLHVLTRIMAPVLPFTTEEAWGHMVFEGKGESVHMSDWPEETALGGARADDELDAKWARILEIRDRVMKLLELKREKGEIGSSLEAAITVCPTGGAAADLVRENIGLFPTLFKVSQAQISDRADDDMEDIPELGIRIKVGRAAGEKCQRCWNFSVTVGNDDDNPDLCGRCSSVMAERSRDGKEEECGQK